MNNFNDTIGNRTCDLPGCSAVPQPTAPPPSFARQMIGIESFTSSSFQGYITLIYKVVTLSPHIIGLHLLHVFYLKRPFTQFSYTFTPYMIRYRIVHLFFLPRTHLQASNTSTVKRQ